MTRNFTLRLPEELAQQLDALRPTGQSQQGQIINILDGYVGDYDPGLVLGFIELIEGEIDAKAICPECHMEFGDKGVWLGFTADLQPFGPICEICATTK